jgi:serine protease Do
MSKHRSAGQRFATGRWGWKLGVLTLGFAGVIPGLTARAALPVPSGNPRRTQLVEVIDKVKDCVVNIHSERTVAANPTEEALNLQTSPSRVNGMGTGIIIDPRGYIITNHHVIDDVQVIRARLSDGTSAPARIIARDHENDLALLKIDVKRPLPTLPIGTASDLMIGESVFAVGNAYGYEHTVTTGIVSALKRDVTLNKEVAYKSLIQTDTAINPGNSGGPLVNINGELIGVNVAIRAGAQNIAFAIPVDTMIRAAADMLSVNRRSGLVHGLRLADKVEPNTSPVVRSVTIVGVESGTAAASNGFQRGDVVVRAADQTIRTVLDFERVMVDRPAGDKIIVVVARDGSEKQMDLVLQAVDRGPVAVSSDVIWRKLGVKLQPAQTDVISRVNNQLHGGLTITELAPDGTARKAGLQKGDILIGLHQWETLSLDNVHYVLNHPDLATLVPLRFFIIRGGQMQRGWIPHID